MFHLVTDFLPCGDQPNAIEKIVKGIWESKKEQVLLGATGTGKTFTMANIIQQTQKSALVLVHNKTLAMQIYQEMQSFFPYNKVEYFVSYFDFYQPEAYKPASDTYIGKKVQRNNNIAKMRLKTLNSLITEKFVIVVASVAAIYGCFNPISYRKVVFHLKKDQKTKIEKVKKKLTHLGYKEEKKLNSGCFQIKKDSVFFMLGWEENYYLQIIIIDDQIKQIKRINKSTGEKVEELTKISIPPSQDYVGEEGEKLEKILAKISKELEERKEYFHKEGSFFKAGRLEKRIQEDLFNLREMGFCPGIENYARYFDGRNEGETPFVLLDYFPKNFLTIIDESHITLPQIKGMYNTNRRRIETLIKHGFRLPSSLDNRPLNQKEFLEKIGYTIYVSATPGEFEKRRVNQKLVEQIIRPTGLLDPKIQVRSSCNPIIDIIQEIQACVEKNEKILIYALTIAMSEDIATFLRERNVRVVYLHSRLEIFERYQAITSLRRGVYDVIVGINLLKEGIDLPEVALVCVLDADKPGFLRDTRSLIQIIGRASRNSNGRVILYADEITKNMKEAINETNRRRHIQAEHNKRKNIIPRSVQKPVKDVLLDTETNNLIEKARKGEIKEKELTRLIKDLKKMMKKASRAFRFDQAIAFRNAILDLENC